MLKKLIHGGLCRRIKSFGREARGGSCVTMFGNWECKFELVGLGPLLGSKREVVGLVYCMHVGLMACCFPHRMTGNVVTYGLQCH